MAEEEKKLSGAERRKNRSLGLDTKKTAKKPDKAAADPEVLVAIKHLIGRKGVDWVEGVWADQHGRPTTRMSFCQGSDMVDKLMKSRLADEKDKLFCISNREDAAELCSRMLYADCYFRCDCTESNTRLVLSKARKQVFEDSTEAAYIITYEGSHWLRYLIGFAIVMIFFGIVLFPVWPDAAKYAVRDSSRYLLMLMLGLLVPLTILRPIVAGLTGWWLLPNLWIEEEFFASFKPAWQAPLKSRDAGGDAIVTIIVTVIIFTGLYVALQTEIIDPDAPEKDMEDDDKDAMFDKLFEEEDVYDPDKVAEQPHDATEDPLPSEGDQPAPPNAAAGGEPASDVPADLPVWDDDEEDDGAELLGDLLDDFSKEQKEMDKKNPYRDDKPKRKVIHGGV